jgi:hypothetical protein
MVAGVRFRRLIVVGGAVPHEARHCTISGVKRHLGIFRPPGVQLGADVIMAPRRCRMARDRRTPGSPPAHGLGPE